MENTTKLNGYKIDFITRTLTITKEFADTAENPDSREYKLIKQFQRDIPNLRIEHRTHKTPTHYDNSNGTRTLRNQFKGLTVERMERFIADLSNSEEVMEQFKYLLKHAHYTSVAKWFMAQFPEYRKNPITYYKAKIVPLNAKLFEKEGAEADEEKHTA